MAPAHPTSLERHWRGRLRQASGPRRGNGPESSSCRHQGRDWQSEQPRGLDSRHERSFRLN